MYIFGEEVTILFYVYFRFLLYKTEVVVKCYLYAPPKRTPVFCMPLPLPPIKNFLKQVKRLLFDMIQVESKSRFEET